jgi:hypothetical protein
VEIPVRRTYFAHAAIALVGVIVCASLVFTKLGWMNFGSLQALGMLLLLFIGLPAGVIAAHSAITVIISLIRHQHVPRDMGILPLALMVGIAWGSVVADLDTPLWTVAAYVPLAGYVVLALVLFVRHRSGHRTFRGVISS